MGFLREGTGCLLSHGFMLSRELLSVELEGDGVGEVLLKVGFFNVVDDGFAAVGKTVEIRVCGVVPGSGEEMVA